MLKPERAPVGEGYDVVFSGMKMQPPGSSAAALSHNPVIVRGILSRLDLGSPADTVLSRAQHIEPVCIASSVTEESAIRLKEEITRWGGKVRIKRSAAASSRTDRTPIPERARHEVWRRDHGRCVDCGSRERLEFDHIIPLSRGGSSTARNIELRCEACNRKKGARI